MTINWDLYWETPDDCSWKVTPGFRLNWTKREPDARQLFKKSARFGFGTTAAGFWIMEFLESFGDTYIYRNE
ncbi:hypothetical protein TNCT_3261 [Trichonephila clavata]|uniref:Uncharacterized protein n=1 Tax=Trichonephila clavata TaxID=2740835 RepID=A0A8X6GM08_TRICU|nr:hypothetical protein TNCT_3261 [Trichonephila clavata]